MKKWILISTVLAVCLCLGAIGCSAAMLGDVNGDGAVTAADARLTLRAAVGLQSLGGTPEAAADIDMNNVLAAADARGQLRVAVGLDTTDGKFYNNAFELLRGGYCSYQLGADGTGLRLLEYAGTRSAAFLSVKSASTYPIPSMTALFTGMDMAAARGSFTAANQAADPGVYFYDAGRAVYSDMTETFRTNTVIRNTLFAALDSTSALNSLPPDVTSLAQADQVSTGKYNDIPCVAYSFSTSAGTLRFYMNGRQLLAADTLNRFGTRTARTTFLHVSPCVAKERTVLPAGYSIVAPATMTRYLFDGTVWELLFTAIEL